MDDIFQYFNTTKWNQVDITYIKQNTFTEWNFNCQFLYLGYACITPFSIYRFKAIIKVVFIMEYITHFVIYNEKLSHVIELIWQL